jgi:predicted MFS family arabinose efflux permease
MRLLDSLLRRVEARVGSRDRAKVVLAFACVLGLDGADKAAIGAMAKPLQHAFHIGQTDLGLLLTWSVGLCAAATLPFGWLVDRVNRVRLLTWIVAGWSVAMALSAFSTSYTFLVVSRGALGAATAATSPAIASLIGDYFQPGRAGARRARAAAALRRKDSGRRRERADRGTRAHARRETAAGSRAP